MVAWWNLLALLSTLVAASSAKDYVCGVNNPAKNSQRSSSLSLNYGVDTNPMESPWLVQLLYKDKKRECAGSLITDRHVLTAGQCVKGVKPEDLTVVYGPRTPYGGTVKVKSAKSTSDADLAVLELSLAVEISANTNPVCVATSFDEKAYLQYKGLHFGPKNKSQADDLARAMYQDVLWRADEKECIDALGKDFNKDTQFCVGKRNQVFAEGIYIGGPILVDSSGRFLQVGIAIKADAEHNFGSATRVTRYHKEISKLVGGNLPGIDTKPEPSTKSPREPSTKPPPPQPDSKYPRLVPLPEQLTFEEAEKACLKLRGTVAAPTEPHFAEYLKGLSQRGPYWALYTDPLGNDTANEKYIDCYAIDTSHKDSAGHYKMITKGCNSILPAVCSIADDQKCSGKKELYFNGYCYKIIGSGDDFVAKQSEEACEKDGSWLASVHSAGENHAIRLLVGDGYPKDAGKCVRLGLGFAVNKTQHSRGRVHDGSSFDFGFQKCNKEGRYPWCPNQPDCNPAPANSVVMYSAYDDGRRCWDDEQDSEECAALCKKKLE